MSRTYTKTYHVAVCSVIHMADIDRTRKVVADSLRHLRRVRPAEARALRRQVCWIGYPVRRRSNGRWA